MLCKQAQEQLLIPNEAPPPEVTQHLTGCQNCQQFLARHRALDALLSADSDDEPRPGFDTRFFARLEAMKGKRVPQRRPLWQWVSLASGAAALAVGFFVVTQRSTPNALVEDMDFAMQLELVEELPLLQQLEEVETYELLAQVDSATLEKLMGEGRP